MAGLKELKVSLTKNGYFKVADVVGMHSASEVLDYINGVYPGINLDRAQISKMLSADEETGVLPTVWDEVKKFGPQATDALTFLSILFSHYTFIDLFKSSVTGEMRGTIKRADTDGKVYTNLVDSMDKMGLGKKNVGGGQFIFNLKPLFQKMEIGPLVKKILYLKLKKTGWSEPGTTDFFYRDFYDQCFFYEFHKVLGISQLQFKDWLEGKNVEIEEPPVVNKDENVVKVSGALISALASKPFAIMSGTSGTGKTQTVRALTQELLPVGFDDNFNSVFIPVEAGWTDGRHLLGFKNPFGPNGEYYATTPLLELLLRANYSNYSNVPFFIVLDEMNLSYVEMYFSKFLSLMETSNSQNPEAILGEEDLLLLLKSGPNAIDATLIESALEKGGLFLTKNVFIVGTVNVDETTHMFSPKVLDRAFVLDFKPLLPSETLSTFDLSDHDVVNAKKQDFWKFIIEDSPVDDVRDKEITSLLDQVWNVLGGFRFGPRVTNESRKYVSESVSLKKIVLEEQKEKAFFDISKVNDRLISQKILPKLHGNKSTLVDVLSKLKKIASQENLLDSEQKISLMIDSLNKNHFANFFS